MKALLICTLVTLIGLLGVQSTRQQESEQAIKAGFLEATKLAGVDQAVVRACIENWPKVYTITEARSLIKKIHNVPKEYVDVFELYIVGLVEHKNSPEWKEKLGGILETMNLPSENIEKFKKIAPESLPTEHGIRKKLLLDSGFDKDLIERIDPYLETVEDMEF